MVRAFVMVTIDPGAVERVLPALLDHERVREAHVVAGEYDAIAEAEADEVYDVLQVAAEVRELDGVADTRTYIAMA